MATPERLLVIRNDKLGDFLLAWPAFALLKASLPETRIHALVPAYTLPLAGLCPWIDAVVEDEGGDHRALARKLAEGRFDATVAFFSTARVARALRGAGIPYRLAPASKWYALFYNRLLRQRRSRSVKPEFEYNLDLARRLLADFRLPAREKVLQTPYLRFPEDEVAATRRDLAERHGLDPSRPWVLIHPGHGGSARNLPPAGYAELGARLDGRAQILVGAGPGERETAEAVRAALAARGRAAVLQADHPGLVDYARIIAAVDLFVGGSTGPLHLAGALDVPTAGFYPRGRVTSALRWRTLNSPDRRLAFAPPPGAHEDDLAAIDLEAAARAINDRFLAP